MWYFRLIQFGLIILLMIYYGMILYELVLGEDTTYTGHNVDDNKIWIPFYMWFNKPNTKKKRK